MKIRWTSKSLRLRINPDELATLRQGLPVTEEMALPGGIWSATIYPTEDSTGISLRRAGALGFLISSSDLAKLAAEGSEGVYFSTGGDQPVRYYIEKDFPCAHPSHREFQEPASDTFSAPAGFKGSCADE